MQHQWNMKRANIQVSRLFLGILASNLQSDTLHPTLMRANS